MNGFVKVVVNLPAGSVEELRAHAVGHGFTMTESLRRALGLQAFLDKEIAGGSKILFEQRNGKMRQLITV